MIVSATKDVCADSRIEQMQSFFRQAMALSEYSPVYKLVAVHYCQKVAQFSSNICSRYVGVSIFDSYAFPASVAFWVFLVLDLQDALIVD